MSIVRLRLEVEEISFHESFPRHILKAEITFLTSSQGGKSFLNQYLVTCSFSFSRWEVADTGAFIIKIHSLDSSD